MSDDRAAALEHRAGTSSAGVQPERPPSLAVTVVRWLVVCATIFATGALGFALPHWGGRLTLPLLPSGIAVAALVRWRRRLWPAVLIASTAIDLGHGATVVQSVCVGVGLAAGAWLTARILERRGFDHTFAHHGDVPLFLGATLVGMILPATIGVLAFRIGAAAVPGYDLISWLRWWSNTSAGVLVAAPLLIAVRRASFEQVRARPVQSTLYFAAAIAVAVATVALPPPGIAAQAMRPPLFVLSLVLAVVGVMRFGLVAASGTALLLSIVVAFSFVFDVGTLSGVAELQGLATLWSYVGAMTGVVLIVTALLAERDAAAAERLRAERRYAQVFEASPQPLWVHDPVTLRFLLVNEATERQYGYGREALLGMRVTELAAPGEEHAVPGQDEAAARGDHEPFETRHVTRDGRTLEVEMWARPIDFGGDAAVLVFATDATERKALGRALIDAIAGEQRRVGQEMHDGLGQELTGLSLTARALAIRAGRERLPFAADLERLSTLIAACIESARRIVQGLSPLSGADGNLVAALAALAERGSAGGVEVRVDSHLEAPLTLPLEARNHLFRIAQEALQNALKHAGARRIDIELTVRRGAVRLAILDDGRGPPDAAAPASGLGMRTMRHRATAIGGRLSIRARNPAGTAVVCEAPQADAVAARTA